MSFSISNSFLPFEMKLVHHIYYLLLNHYVLFTESGINKPSSLSGKECIIYIFSQQSIQEKIQNISDKTHFFTFLFFLNSLLDM